MSQDEIIEQKVKELIELSGVSSLGMILNAYMGAKISGQDHLLVRAVAECVVKTMIPNVKNSQARQN